MSRRELLRNAGATGMAAIFPWTQGDARLARADESREDDADVQEASSRGSSNAALHVLTAFEAEILDAVVARLIPSDENGPGAREAGALGYIDRALSGPDADLREVYRKGLAGLDRYSEYSRGAPFTDLSGESQDRVLSDLQTNGAADMGMGFLGSPASFFNVVKNHTWEGTFGDPSYGGNRDFIGWSLIGYPGVRLGVTPETQQRLEEGTLEPEFRSAYDFDLFDYGASD